MHKGARELGAETPGAQKRPAGASGAAREPRAPGLAVARRVLWDAEQDTARL